ncbi:sulfurtransferase complex subunit TusC [Methylomagnum ishizawai]|uniref:sulfurtransferase complex subunit TusC n=1 Tax=Methylomagnum ishizawai TaxID=1760988 RepID=UPI001C33FF93|nr:sulfurtransferase complex subunit TusC [Methylomagnum ishizawai]BBL75766.1 sulfurtransferase TusC [Methylomagnum ishizawai]
MAKKLLFVLRHPPHAGFRLRESLDMILTAAAFDQTVALLFLGDGVYPLKRGQHPEAAGLPPVAQMFEALELYDVDEVWVERESLAERGLEPADLIIPVRLLDRAAVAGLTAAQDIVVAC